MAPCGPGVAACSWTWTPSRPKRGVLPMPRMPGLLLGTDEASSLKSCSERQSSTMSDTVSTLTRKTFNASMENVLCNGTRYADLAPDTRNMLWAAYNLTGDQGTMPVDQWAAV